jgi:hypothetical protein
MRLVPSNDPIGFYNLTMGFEINSIRMKEAVADMKKIVRTKQEFFTMFNVINQKGLTYQS